MCGFADTIRSCLEEPLERAARISATWCKLKLNSYVHGGSIPPISTYNKTTLLVVLTYKEHNIYT